MKLSLDESRLAQWPFFDERGYLNIDQGKNETFLVDFFNNNPNSVGDAWLGAQNDDRLQVGAVRSRLEPYRNSKISNIRLNGLVGIKSFNCFPFTMLKFGQTHTPNESAAAIAANYDQALVNQLLFEDMDMQYLLSYGNVFNNFNIDNCNLRFCYMERTGFRFFTWENSDFTQVAFGFPNNPEYTDWHAGVVVDCVFISCPMSRIRCTNGTSFYNCRFSGGEMRSPDGDTEKVWGTMQKCEFLAMSGNLRFSYLQNCKLKYFNADFGGLNYVDNFHDCELDLCTIKNPQLGYIKGTKVRDTTLTGTLTLLDHVDVRGVDFTGTNLTTVTGGYANKAAFMAALDAKGTNRYNAATLWIDGTSLTA